VFYTLKNAKSTDKLVSALFVKTKSDYLQLLSYLIIPIIL
jgi:hypothetical protein